jgi:Trk K+ transport system NAD-binding subunit
MNIIIVGAGAIGLHMARTLSDQAGTMQESLTTDATDGTDSRTLLGKVNAECGSTNW